MKLLLFLDVDGVLNNTAFYERRAKTRSVDLAARYSPREDFDPANVAQLAELAKRVPSLEVVVSSTWRLGRPLEELRAYLRPAFAPERVLGVTPRLESRLRWQEIKTWLDLNGHAGARFLALDDDTFDMHPLGQNFLHVHRDAGLTPEHVEKAVAFFMRLA